MRVTMNSAPVTGNFAGATLNAVLEQLRAVCPPGELIVGIRVDGQPWNESQIGASLNEVLKDASQIDVETAGRSATVAAALRAVADRMSAAAEDQRWAGQKLDGGDVAAGIRQVGEFLKTFQLARQTVVEASGLLGRDITQFEFERHTVGHHLNELGSRLAELRNAIAARDLVLLGDLLNFDTPEVCERWAAIFAELATQVERDQPVTA